MDSTYSGVRRGVPLPLTLLATAIVLASFVLLIRRLDILTSPWAYTHDGRPGLPGTWVGRLTTGGGRPRVVMLTIKPHGWGGDCRRCTRDIRGAALTCDERGRVWHYRIDGSSHDRWATDIHLSSIPDSLRGPDGLEMDALRGRWDRGDTLTMEAEFHWRRGKSAISSTADPDTKGWVPLQLTRGTQSDFAAGCARVRGPAIREVVP